MGSVCGFLVFFVFGGFGLCWEFDFFFVNCILFFVLSPVVLLLVCYVLVCCINVLCIGLCISVLCSWVAEGSAEATQR